MRGAPQTAIVGREDDQGLLAQRVLFQGLDDLPDRVVEALDHRRVRRVLLVRLLLLLVLLGELLLGLDRRVYRVGRVVQEERAIFVAYDEARGLVAFAIGQVLAFRARWEGRNPLGQALRAVGVEVARGLAVVATAVVLVEPLMLWEPGLVAQMPLADVSGAVTVRPQDFRNGDFVEFHPERVRGTQQLAPVASHVCGGVLDGFLVAALEPRADPVRDVRSRRIAPGHHRGTCRRTHGARRIALGEAQPFTCEPIDVGRLVVLAALACEIGPAEVVDEDEDDVWFVLGNRACVCGT